MSNYHYVGLETILLAKATNGVGTTLDVRDFQNIVVSISSASSANLTIKCQGSISESSPDFSIAASSSNQWGYIGIYELDGATLKAGSTGVVYAGTDSTGLYSINTDGLTWLNFQVSGYAAGNITVQASLFNNQ